MRYGPAMSAPRRAKPAITFRVSAGCPHDAPRRQTALTSCPPSRGFASRRKRWDDERIAETGLVLMAMSTTGWQFSLATGLFIGLAQGCTTFSIVFGVVSRVFPPERRGLVRPVRDAALHPDSDFALRLVQRPAHPRGERRADRPARLGARREARQGRRRRPGAERRRGGARGIRPQELPAAHRGLLRVRLPA